jgi:hypothetical protein
MQRNEYTNDAHLESIFRAIGDAIIQDNIIQPNIIQPNIPINPLAATVPAVPATTSSPIAIHDVDEYVVQEDATASIEPQPMTISRSMDSAVHLLGSKQDIVYTTEHVLANGDTQWTMALFDGHGYQPSYLKNPSTGKIEKHNLTLLSLQALMAKESEDAAPRIDALLAKDIFDEEEDPALALQRELGKDCLMHKRTTLSEGATMILLKMLHSVEEHTITVDVLSVGDSTVTIHCNGEKVLDVTPHENTNECEIQRLRDENRFSRIQASSTFEIIDENKVVSAPGVYIWLKNGAGIAMTQSIGHLQNYGGKIVDERGSFGLAPYKRRFVFSDTDEINIKGFSDGVSDVLAPAIIPGDIDLLRCANAVDTAEFAKARWQKDWMACKRGEYLKCKAQGESLDTLQGSVHNFGDGADDISCVCWMQRKM